VKQSLGILLILGLSFSSQARDSAFLIQEMEKLRDSLSLEDPSRFDLTLRLADLYFDSSVEQEGSASESREKKKAHRLKALELYSKSLETGTLKEGTRLKIQFQMARLLTRLNEHKKAESYYLAILKAENLPNKMKEQSALSLAEWYDEQARFGIALKHYLMALDLCQGAVSCNYIHYRKGWLHFKNGELDLAISTMKKSLWTNREQQIIRESSLMDLMMFLSNTSEEGKSEYTFIEGISKELNREELKSQLAEAFFVAGNRKAGSYVLSRLNEKNPQFYYEVRLLEEYYGFRNWEKVEYYLSSLGSAPLKAFPTKKEEREQSQKILQRYLVQIDSETQIAKSLTPLLLQSIDLYLSYYPNDELRKKLQQAWLKSQEDEQKKVDRLDLWIAQGMEFSEEQEELRKMRQTRLSLAQNLKHSDIIVHEALELVKIYEARQGESSKVDQFRYIAARELYRQKNFDQALPLFTKIVSQGLEEKNFSQWVILSQNLTLDIYNTQKNFSALIDQIDNWKNVTSSLDTPLSKELKKENQAMALVYQQARFEKAASEKKTQEHLDLFFDYCFKKVFEEKSCANAKVLAVELADQEKIIRLLQREKAYDDLMVEYERMGEFSKAAQLIEQRQLKKPLVKNALPELMRIALLYELDQNWKDRDRFLNLIVKKFRQEKSIEEKYQWPVYLTLKEAGFITERSFDLNWKPDIKLALALEQERSKTRKKTRDYILSQEQSVGPVWGRLVLQGLEKEYAKVQKMTFHGRRSQTRFKRKIRAIERFIGKVRPKLEGADFESRVYLLQMAINVYDKMEKDILSSPIPEGLDEQTLIQVKEQINQLSIPYHMAKADFLQLREQQYKENKTHPRLKMAQENTGIEETKFSHLLPVAKPIEARLVSSLDFSALDEIKQDLKKQPRNKALLKKLKSFYKRNQFKRLEVYFKDRIEELAL
jgi:hypothetical protein